MSIGLAAVLEDGVFLAADGRTTRVFAEVPDINDNARKLEQVSVNIAAVTFGFQQATENSVTVLRNSVAVHGLCLSGTIASLVREAVEFGWEFLIKHRLTGPYDINHPAMRAALIVGGIGLDGPFVTATLIRSNSDGSKAVDSQTVLNGFVMLGGEELNAADDFAEKAGEAFKHSSIWGGSPDEFALAIKDAAMQTIRCVAQHDKTIGGMARYAFIRSGRDYEEGVLCQLN